MTIQIDSPELEALIEQRIRSGAFANAEAVIFHAVRSMEWKGLTGDSIRDVDNEEWDIISDEFAEAAAEAGLQARRRTLDAGFPVISKDDQGRYIQEFPDGRLFHIEFDPQQPRDSHIRVLSEITALAKR